MERFCDILGAVQKTSGSTFLSCEPELVELMRQIDGMVEEKKKEWQTQINILNEQLHKKSEESQMRNRSIETLDKQVKVLRHQLLNERNSQKGAISQYDSHICKLKDEVTEMRKKHERLLKKNEKFQTKKQSENEELVRSLSMLQKDNEYLTEQKSTLEKENNMLKKKIVEYENTVRSVNSQNDKTIRLEKQIAKYQLDLQRQKDLYSNLEINTAKEMALLREDLKTCQGKLSESETAEKMNAITREQQQQQTKQTADRENKELLSRMNSIKVMNDKLQQVLALKDKKIKQLHENCDSLKATLQIKKTADVSPSDDVTRYKNQINHLESLLSQANQNLDDKITSLQLCESKLDRLQMENRYFQSVLPLPAEQIRSRDNELGKSTSLYGISELEKENSDLFRKLKALQIEFASTAATSYENFDIPENDETGQSESVSGIGIIDESCKHFSVIEKFLEQEKEREAQLCVRLKNRMKEFDQKCEEIVSADLLRHF